MELEIEPEPTPEERVAIERALAALGATARTDGRSAWWRAGLAAALDGQSSSAGRAATSFFTDESPDHRSSV